MSRRVGLEFGVTSVLLALLAVLGTIAVSRNDVRVDVTKGDRRTLSPQTTRVLELLDQPVEVLTFYAERPAEQARVVDLIDRYREVQPSITLRSIDPDRRPDLADEYGVAANGTVVLAGGDLRIRMVDPDEARLTAGFLRLLSAEPPVVLFTTGHGESSLEDDGSAGWSEASALLMEQNFDVRLLATAATARVPDNVALVVMAGPESELSPREADLLTDHVGRGGSVLAMLEPAGAATADSLVAELGIRADAGFVVDQSPEQANLTRGGDGRIALAIGSAQDHPITRDFNFNALFPLARSLQVVQPVPPGVRASRLLETQAATWTERGGVDDNRGGLSFDPLVDRAGPLALAYAVEIDLRRFHFGGRSTSANTSSLLDMLGDAVDVRDTSQVDTLRAGDLSLRGAPAERARLVVIGDTSFANNANLRVQGNAQLLLASVLWLTEQEDRIALPPRPDLNDPIVLTPNTVQTLRIVVLAVAPLIFFAVGGWMLWRRRQWV